jgi:hypothetical protein
VHRIPVRDLHELFEMELTTVVGWMMEHDGRRTWPRLRVRTVNR